MNKWLWMIVAILTVWVLKLSVDVYRVNTKSLSILNTALDQQAQRLGNLNDQLVAMQQKQTSLPIAAADVASLNTAQTQPHLDAHEYTKHYVYDRLKLTQLAIEQQQFNLALQYIQGLREQLQQDKIFAGSETLNAALIEALVRDQANIVLYLQQRNEHVQLLQQQLKNLNQLLVPKPLTQQYNKWDISHWFNLSKQSQVPDLAQRNLNYKSLQLQVLLAHQALLAGQIDFYRQQVKDILQQVKMYPDEAAQQSIQQLKQIETLTLGGIPHMTALALMRGN